MRSGPRAEISAREGARVSRVSNLEGLLSGEKFRGEVSESRRDSAVLMHVSHRETQDVA